MSDFRTPFGDSIFQNKYQLHPNESWADRAFTVVEDVCGFRLRDNKPTAEPILNQEDRLYLTRALIDQKWFPGGRYLYYAGRDKAFFNNCLLMDAEDTREGWAALNHNTTSALMSGAGIGVHYSKVRPEGIPIGTTGGFASGPLSLMTMTNEIGRNVMQGGSRRSAIYASLNWMHGDAKKFLTCKDWDSMVVGDTTVGDLKKADFEYPAPLDMTNISLNYDDEFLVRMYEMPFKDLLTIYEEQGAEGIFNLEIKNIPDMFLENCRQACKTGEPGMSFNFFDKVLEVLRNACCEVVSEDDSDICNLASINMANIESKEEMYKLSAAVSKFLVCGTIRADVPYDKVTEVRTKNRRLGLGLMGVHEFQMKNGDGYSMSPHLQEHLLEWKVGSEQGANELCDYLGISRPVAYRAIAPTGTIGILAGTTTGIEPLFAVAYKRRYLVGRYERKYEFVIDGTAREMISRYNLKPEEIETALTLAETPEKRIAFQAAIQKYCDQAISSTINLPAWGSEFNNEDTVQDFAKSLAKYAIKLRGFTCYPDGARGGQPLTAVDYYEALENEGVVFEEHDICDISGKGGSCGV